MGKDKDRKDYKGFTPLKDHQREGKTLLSPFSKLGNMSFSSWVNDALPNMLWAALLIGGLGRDMALDRLRALGLSVKKQKEKWKEGGITHTFFATLPPEVLEGFLAVLLSDNESKTALRPLLLFPALPARAAWENAIGAAAQEADWEPLKRAVALTLDHQSQEATDCRWFAVLQRIAIEKLFLRTEDQVKEVVGYPNYGDQRSVRPMIRATEISFREKNPPAGGWCELFWQDSMTRSACETFPPKVAAAIEVGTTAAKCEDAYAKVVAHCRTKVKTTDIDPKHDTIFGFALYALTQLKELLALGNNARIIARHGLRSLLECFVTLTYLSEKGGADGWLKYRNYGVGQAKLAFLKMEELENRPSYVNYDTLKMLANEDRWQEFVDIDLGDWEKSDLRKRSEAAGVKEEYDRYYGWTSGFIHGNWSAVRDTIFETCANPVHRLHRIPRPLGRSLEDVIADASRLVNRILQVVDKQYPPFDARV